MLNNSKGVNNQSRYKHSKLFVYCVILLLSAIKFTQAVPDDDKIENLPGYPSDFPARVFAGYLKTSSQLRKLHYVFIQSYKGQKNTLPVTLWMNGGPGCSSLIGFAQQIGPYLLPLFGGYQHGSQLKQNIYSWLNLTNLLFIDGPASVGYSMNKDPDYKFNDKNTAQDNLDALINFFTDKFPQYNSQLNPFYIAGQSYAGKYIPDLALSIQNYNSQDKKINLKGIILGNPALYFKDGSMEDSQIQFMKTHNLIDPKLYPNWEGPCHTDVQSASCQFFYSRYQELLMRVDFYNIYGPCFRGQEHPSQALFMKKTAKKNSRILKMTNGQPFKWTQFSQCFNDKGVNDYFTTNAKSFNSQVSNFSICNETIYEKYDISEGGSMAALQSLIGMGSIKVYFFSGDWDDVCPFTDTIKNLNRMGLVQDGPQTPWKIGTQHVGFIRTYNKKVKLFLIKGAGHQVPAYKPQQSYKMFQMFLNAN